MDLSQILLPIATPLAEVDDAIRAACATTVPTITQVVHYTIEGGGKRLRPALTLLSAFALGYTGHAGTQIGAALEMIHTASLLHDDVIDHATVRRGRASVNAAWGNQVSVLVGDFFWCRACQLIIEHGSPAMLHTITDAIAATTQGEILELMNSNDFAIDELDYLQILEGKTARLIGVCCEAGAMLFGATGLPRQALNTYGIALGMAFQLADDVLDYTAAADNLGKTIGTDLREGRLTLPLIHATRNANDTERALIRRCVSAPDIGDADLARILDILDRHQSIRYTKRKAIDYIGRAQYALAALPQTLYRIALYALADYALRRDH